LRYFLIDVIMCNTVFLYSHFFQINVKPSIEEIEAYFSHIQTDAIVTIFLCHDGDTIMSFENPETDLIQNVIDAVAAKYKADIEPIVSFQDFFRVYDLVESYTELRSECFKKQKQQSKKSQELAKYLSNEQLISTLKKTMQLINMQRSFRTKPHVLIVEDQIFSQKLLASALKDYTCYISENVGDALLTYVEKCPDILLLDIDLPDVSGHQLAKIVKRIDDHAYTVMISANRYHDDIQSAQENQVKGFVAKPFKKDDILNILDGFQKNKKRKI